jgi:hypothetical protein
MFGIYIVANHKLDSCNFINNGAAVRAMPSYGGVNVSQYTNGIYWIKTADNSFHIAFVVATSSF